jgi:hypothetical protein
MSENKLSNFLRKRHYDLQKIRRLSLEVEKVALNQFARHFEQLFFFREVAGRKLAG